MEMLKVNIQPAQVNKRNEAVLVWADLMCSLNSLPLSTALDCPPWGPLPLLRTWNLKRFLPLNRRAVEEDRAMFGGTPRFSSIHRLPERALKRDSAAPVFPRFSSCRLRGTEPTAGFGKVGKVCDCSFCCIDDFITASRAKAQCCLQMLYNS